ncbi:hypothetical protein P7C70_g7031, partial [Phenoliferia sp. Uapishka_3]
MIQTHLILPTELVDQILLNLAPPPLALQRNWDKEPSRADLCNAAIVSTHWNGAARRVLYGRLIVNWRGGIADKLLRTFEENPYLSSIVQHFAVCYTEYEDWIQEWTMTEAADKAEERAAQLYPDQLPDEYTEQGEDYQAYVYEAQEDAAEAAGDGKWLVGGSAGRLGGSDLLWSLVTLFSNLRSLEVKDLDQPINAGILYLLKPLLSRLPRVTFSSYRTSQATCIIPLLKSVDVLCISADLDLLSPTTATGSIRYLRVRSFHGPLLGPGLELTTLIGLDLWCRDQLVVLDVIDVLPTLMNLNYLRFIHDPYPGGHNLSSRTYDLLFKSIQRLPLTHLYLNTFPSTSQLQSLPPSIETLDFDCSDVPELLTRLSTVPTWKELYVPALKVLSIARSGKHPWRRATRTVFVERTTAFTIQLRGVSDEETPELPGPW